MRPCDPHPVQQAAEKGEGGGVLIIKKGVRVLIIKKGVRVC